MSFQKFEIKVFYVGKKHYIGSKNSVGETTFNKKTGREVTILVGLCSVCNRLKPL